MPHPDELAALQAKLAHAEATVARLKSQIAQLQETPYSQESQHEAVNHLEDYLEEATFHWRDVLSFLERALREVGLRSGRQRRHE